MNHSVRARAIAWRTTTGIARPHQRSRCRPHLGAAGVVLFALFLAAECITAHSQKTPAPADPSLMRQLQQAVSVAKQGDPQRSMTLTQQILEKHADFVPALKLKGSLLEDSGRPSEAGAVYEQGLRLAPNDPDLLLKTGIYKLATGDKQAALDLLLHCTRILPGDGDAQFYLAQAYHLNGQDDLALRAMQKAARAEPDNAFIAQKYGELLCSTRDYAEGLRWLSRAKQTDPTLPRLDYDLAWAEYNLMDFAKAVEYSARAAKERPGDGNALLLLAAAQVKLQHWQDARDAFAGVLSIKGPNEEASLGLGHCELELKHYEAAVENLQSALRLNPVLLLAHFYLARAYAGLGKTADAEREAALHHLMMEQATFVRSRESEERDSAIEPEARQLLEQHREHAALNLYRERFKASSATLADAHVFIGKTHLFMGNTADGVRNLNYALKLDPKVRGAHTYQGILALKDGKLAEAESDFNAELANDPNAQTALAELGEVRYRQQRWSEAAEQISRSHTSTPELLYMLCDSDLHLGKVQHADLIAELVAAYGRNNPQLMQGLLALLRGNGRANAVLRVSAVLNR